MSGGDRSKRLSYLGSSGDHVLDEVTMSGSIDDGDIVLGGLELPESDIDGDTFTRGKYIKMWFDKK